MSSVREPPQSSTGISIARTARSARRTSTIDISWPDGAGGNMRVVGRARDIITTQNDAAAAIPATAQLEALLGADRTLLRLDTTPGIHAVHLLAGLRFGSGARRALAQLIPDERGRATLLHLLIDDIAGASLVANWAWSQWHPAWIELASAALPVAIIENRDPDSSVCAGFAPGSSAFDPDTRRPTGAPATDLPDAGDSIGWHRYPAQVGVGMRRARRLDVQVNRNIVINAAFQDSATTPGGSRAVVHEYSIKALADRQSLQLLKIDAVPHVVPYGECTFAVDKLTRVIGLSLGEMRDTVSIALRGANSCTHLNDLLRSFDDVPALMAHLDSP